MATRLLPIPAPKKEIRGPVRNYPAIFRAARLQFDELNVRRACLFSFVLLLAGLLTGCWEGISRQVFPTVLSADGAVAYLSKGSTSFRPVDSQPKLGAGAILKTSSGARINLVLIPGALAQISGDSELKIDELKLRKDGNETGDAIRERIARIELRRGSMVVLFEGVARFTIETREATIRVLPSCLLRLDVDERGTRVTCVRGKFYATPQNGQIVAVDAGYFREWPSERGAVSTAEDPRSQTDVTATLEVARELQELAGAQRDRLPF
jgi:FecR protein